MWRCFEADLEILVHRGHLYLPLVLDPEINQEIQAPISPSYSWDQSPGGLSRSPVPTVLAVLDRWFVQAVSASSLVDNYAQTPTWSPSFFTFYPIFSGGMGFRDGGAYRRGRSWISSGSESRCPTTSTNKRGVSWMSIL
jgi:hypothetical protein